MMEIDKFWLTVKRHKIKDKYIGTIDWNGTYTDTDTPEMSGCVWYRYVPSDHLYIAIYVSQFRIARRHLFALKRTYRNHRNSLHGIFLCMFCLRNPTARGSSTNNVITLVYLARRETMSAISDCLVVLHFNSSFIMSYIFSYASFYIFPLLNNVFILLHIRRTCCWGASS